MFEVRAIWCRRTRESKVKESWGAQICGCWNVLFRRFPRQPACAAPRTQAGAGAAQGAFAANYEFLAAPATDLNRVYRLDRAAGEIGACQYGLKEGAVGVTLCYPPGEGAGPKRQANIR